MSMLLDQHSLLYEKDKQQHTAMRQNVNLLSMSSAEMVAFLKTGITPGGNLELEFKLIT